MWSNSDSHTPYSMIMFSYGPKVYNIAYYAQCDIFKWLK